MKKKNGCLGKIFLLLLIVGLTLFGLFKLSPSSYDAVKKDVKASVFGEDSIPTNKVVLTDSIKEKPIILIDSIDNDVIEIPINLGSEKMSYVVVNVNDIPMRFVLDTGCSDMMITLAELYFLRHNDKIAQTDSVGVAVTTYANGTKETNPCYAVTLSIGHLTAKNVNCVVANTFEAEPLLGLGALSKLGDVSIDYGKKKLIIKPFVNKN